jgi:hypothetical protein
MMKDIIVYLTFLTILSSCGRQENRIEQEADQTPAEKPEIIFRQPSPYVLQFIGNDTIHLNSINYNSFRIYFRENSYASNHLPKIKTELDSAFNRILSILNIEGYNHGIYLLAVDSKEEMQKVMGYKIKGGAATGHDLVFFAFNDTIRPQFKHEIFHLISYETWGPTKYRLLDEGGATYTDDFCFYENPMFSINAYFLKENKLFELEELINNFDAKAKENDVIAYIQSAGYFKFLYENFGVDKMKKLWTDGFEKFEEIYGFSIDEFEAKWIDAIKEVPIPQDIDEELLMTQGCG